MKLRNRKVADRAALQNFEQIERLLSASVDELPSNGTDGQEISYLADAANGIEWGFKYRAASASPSKWVFNGGSPLRVEAGFYQGVTTYSTLQTITGLSVSVPLDGDYYVRFGAAIMYNQVAAINQMEMIPAKTGNVQLWTAGQAPAVIAPPVAGTGAPLGLLECRANGLAAGDTVFLRVRSSTNVSFQVYSPELHIMPIRVG